MNKKYICSINKKMKMLQKYKTISLIIMKKLQLTVIMKMKQQNLKI